MKNSEYTLYLDMDGVLVDFQRGVQDIYYSLSKSMDKVEREKETQRRYAQGGAQFWVGLDWMQGGKELWAAAKNLFETVCVLSSAQAKTTFTARSMGATCQSTWDTWLKSLTKTFVVERQYQAAVSNGEVKR